MGQSGQNGVLHVEDAFVSINVQSLFVYCMIGEVFSGGGLCLRQKMPLRVGKIGMMVDYRRR